MRLRRVKEKLVCLDPRRRAILARIRWIWRHLPPQGVLLFFDVKCITVKTYGGRRYTTAKGLVLPRPQKTRGKFYLFLLYEVNRGKVHWAFMPSKDSEPVCWFMRQVRRWYAEREVWIALDQDRPHPCKSRRTRRTMRELNLHWISMPKRSPDDNPVETLFSDVQLMVLDNTDDPDVKTTQHRISAHLRRRNRRRERQVRIHYLPDSHRIK